MSRLQTSWFGDGVFCFGGATRLVVNSTDIEALVTLEERIALDSDGSNAGITRLDGAHDTAESRGSAQQDGGQQRGG